MFGEVDSLLDNEADIVLVLKKVNLLLVIHDEERLSHCLVCVVLDALTVGLQGHDLTTC